MFSMLAKTFLWTRTAINHSNSLQGQHNTLIYISRKLSKMYLLFFHSVLHKNERLAQQGHPLASVMTVSVDICDSGYSSFVSHRFLPTCGDKLQYFWSILPYWRSHTPKK